MFNSFLYDINLSGYFPLGKQFPCKKNVEFNQWLRSMTETIALSEIMLYLLLVQSCPMFCDKGRPAFLKKRT